MAFFNSAVTVLQTLVIALGAGLGIWGAINLLEGYGNDNESLKNGYCAIEKCHNIFLLKFEIVLRIEKALRTTGIKTGRKA
jgi:hypothetical protein